MNCVCEREDRRMLDLFKNVKKMTILELRGGGRGGHSIVVEGA